MANDHLYIILDDVLIKAILQVSCRYPNISRYFDMSKVNSLRDDSFEFIISIFAQKPYELTSLNIQLSVYLSVKLL